MDPSTLFRVAPTFPIDDDRIRMRRRAKIACSPWTLGGVAVATLLGIVAQAGVPGFIALYALAAFGLRWYWGKRRPGLDADSLREVIAESNVEQDREMSRIIRELDGQHFPQYAVCLARFLLLKQKIEKELHKGPCGSLHAEEIEKRVDGVCAEVCREITQVIERERGRGEVLTSRSDVSLERLEAAQRQSHASILHAYTTLYQTHAELINLESVTLPREVGPPPVPASEKRLNQLVGELEEEAAFIARTRERIRSSLEGKREEGVSAAPPMVAE